MSTSKRGRIGTVRQSDAERTTIPIPPWNPRREQAELVITAGLLPGQIIQYQWHIEPRQTNA